jgi:hypothetical protein
MEQNIGSILGGSSIGVLTVYLVYKYLQKHKIKIISGCCQVELQEDRTPPKEKDDEIVKVEDLRIQVNNKI